MEQLMQNVTPLKSALASLAMVSIAALTLGCSGAQAASRADNIPAPSVDIPAPPPVTLSTHVLEAASEYRAYLAVATKLATHYENGEAIEKTLADAEKYEPQQLVRGAVAYGAVIALQDPAFVAGVRIYATNAAIRKDMAERIIADPNYATAMPGAATAAAMIQLTMNQHGRKITELGRQMKQAAYDIQKRQPWSTSFISDREGRLARAKILSATPMTPVPEDVRRLSDAVSGSPEFVKAELGDAQTADPVQPPFTPLVARSLAVAALATLGHGGEEDEAAMQSLLTESNSGFCLNMSKLNLYQCLAVAKPWYEDVFCMGTHAVADVGTCLSKASGARAEVAAPVRPSPEADASSSAGHETEKKRPG
jgi:hypothetical protein